METSIGGDELGKLGGGGRNRLSLVFHKPLEINRLWHR
jgi:hypothetical protein